MQAISSVSVQLIQTQDPQGFPEQVIQQSH